LKIVRGAFDFEAWNWVNTLCCGIMDESGYSDFLHDETHTHPEQLAEKALWALYANSSVSEWWAHNMGKYDGLHLSAAAFRLGWFQKAIMAGGNRVISLQLRPPGSERFLSIYDSYALVPSALRNIADDFDLPSKKLFSKDDYSTDPRSWSKDKLKEGCLADCRLVLELLGRVETLVESWGGQLRRTFSSTALSIVKAKLNETGTKLPSHFENPEANTIAGRGYYGARVEVLHHMPTYQLIEYDVCSSYPAAMAQPLPWKFKRFVVGREANKLFEANESMIVEATVNVPKTTYLPCLPYRPTAKDGVFFPTGIWKAWFPSCELHYARRQNVEIKIHEGALYTTEMPFAAFINDVYALKRTAKGAVRNFAKLLLNGCYGKFGERPEHTELQVFPTEYEGLKFQLENPGICTPIHESNQMLAVTKEKWSAHAHYGIASFITARARIALHSYLTESVQPAYCDSDSIHCKEWSGSVSDDLGALKVEIPNYQGIFYAPKIYRLLEPSGKLHIACKGFPVDPASFDAMVNSAKERIKQPKRKDIKGAQTQRMRLLKSQLRSGGIDVIRIYQNKTWRGLSMKRKPFSNGETEPWTVNELLEGKQKEAISPCILHQ
jgi:hypothetical protein